MAEMILQTALVISLIGIILSFIRFMKGPSAADRVVALDSVTLISVSVIIFVALFAGRSVYIDAAMVYAILSFIGVVAVARYLEGGL